MSRDSPSALATAELYWNLLSTTPWLSLICFRTVAADPANEEKVAELIELQQQKEAIRSKLTKVSIVAAQCLAHTVIELMLHARRTHTSSLHLVFVVCGHFSATVAVSSQPRLQAKP